MLADSLLVGFLSFLSFFLSCRALRIPIQRSDVERSTGAKLSKFRLGANRATRPQVLANTNGDESGDVGLATHNDLLYMANVTISGEEFTLQLDTGSSDLWVATTSTLPNSQNSTIPYNLTYGIGYAAGYIFTAPVSFAGVDISSQAFLLATDSNNPVSTYGAAGILGLGFTSLSSIDSAVNKSGNSWGRSFLHNAFLTQPSTPNFITFSLQRVNDPQDDVTGTFTIGEYVDGLDSISQMPNISTWPENSPNRWNILLDGFYIGGVEQPLSSAVIGAPDGKAVTLIDSGTSYSYVDPNIVKAMYGSIPGASFDSSSGMWTVPCDAEVDITLVYGGNPYPVHPLDVVDHSLNDASACTGTFVGQSLSVGNGQFDWLIGDNVLRSIYTLYDFGDFQPDKQMGNPYVKLLSITNLTAASADFHSIRGGSPNVTVSATGVNFNGTNSVGASSVTDNLQSDINKLLNYIPVLLGILGFNSVVILGIAICAIIYMRRRGGKDNKGPAERDSYHYHRVRSQYEPQDAPPPSPHPVGMPLYDVSNQARPSTSLSKSKTKDVPDSPFTPPVEVRLDEADGDMSNAALHPLDMSAGAHHPMPSPGSSAVDGSPSADLPLPVPRPRFVSTTTMSSDGYGNRPQSLFSTASGPLLGAAPSQFGSRPASAYDFPAHGPRPRFISGALSDGRPESTFSTSPLVPKGPQSPVPNSPLSERMRPTEEFEGEEMMAPPRPRFMSDANSGPRPDSSFSMGSPPLRPQSKFMDLSGARPASQAM